MTTTRTSFVCKSITSFAVNTQFASLRMVTEDNYVQFLKSPPCVGYNSFFFTKSLLSRVLSVDKGPPPPKSGQFHHLHYK